MEEFSTALINVVKNMKYLLSFSKNRPKPSLGHLLFEEKDEDIEDGEIMSISMNKLEFEIDLFDSYVKKYVLLTINRRVGDFIKPFTNTYFKNIEEKLKKRENIQKSYQNHRNGLINERSREEIRNEERKQLNVIISLDSKCLNDCTNDLIIKFREMLHFSSTYWKIEIPLVFLYFSKYILSFIYHLDKAVDSFQLDTNKLLITIQTNLSQKKYVDGKLPYYSERFKNLYSELLFHEYTLKIKEVDVIDKPLENRLFPLLYNPVVEKAIAIYDCKGEHSNELSFKKGDVIIIHEKKEGWWVGDLRGCIGEFPSNYVELL